MSESTPVPPTSAVPDPTPAAPDLAPAVPRPMPPVPDPLPASPSQSRWSRALRWTTGLLVVFALGLGATWMVQVRPLRQQVAVLEQEQGVLQEGNAELQAQVTQMEGVRAENVALLVRQAKLDQSFALLKARVSTLRAQLILSAGGEAQEAAQALVSADSQLAILEQALAGSQQEGVQILRERLALAIGELESDPFAARRDLEVLANGLDTMEMALSGG